MTDIERVGSRLVVGVLLPLIGLVGGCSPADSPTRGCSIYAEQEEVDLGETYVGRARAIFRVQNRGTVAAALTGFRSSCNCVGLTVQGQALRSGSVVRIPAAGTAEISALVEVEPGANNVVVQCATTDARTPNLALGIRAYGKLRYDVRPSEIKVNGAEGGCRMEYALSVTANDVRENGRLDLEVVKSPGIASIIRELPGRCGVIGFADIPDSVVMDEALILKTNRGDTIRVPIRGRPTPSVVVQPAYVFAEIDGEAVRRIERKLKLRISKKRRIRDLNVTAIQSAANKVVGTINTRYERGVITVVVEQRSAAGEIHGRVQIRHSGILLVSVPVLVRCGG